MNHFINHLETWQGRYHVDIMTFKTTKLDRENTIVVKHKTLITVNLSLLHFVLYNRSLTIVLEIDTIDQLLKKIRIYRLR